MNTGTITLIALTGLAAWSDLRTRRIPNALTVTGLVAALALRATIGLDAVGTGLLGSLLALLVTLPLFAAGGLGAGDVKLLVACGAFLGPKRLLVGLAATAILGGLMALVAAVRRGATRQTLAGCRDIVWALFSPARRATLRTIRSPGAVTIPYGVAIAAGTLVAWFL